VTDDQLSLIASNKKGKYNIKKIKKMNTLNQNKIGCNLG
jgi:hypothetical protein